MSMTYKDFIALALNIKQHNSMGIEPFTARQIDTLAAFCSAQNPKFNRARWLLLIK